MKVGVLLITHPGIGSAILHVASRIIGQSLLSVKCLEVPPDVSLESTLEHARGMLEILNTGDGVLILTDIYGATPHNLAHTAALEQSDSVVLSGLNLPMLLRVFNYPDDDLNTLAGKAAEGGNRGIMRDPQHTGD